MQSKEKFEDCNNDRWVWLDLEMTGLDENNCVILQAAMIITDPQLNCLCEIDIPIWQPESSLSSMVPIVKNMHTKNNLLDRVRLAEHSLEQAETLLMQLLTKHVAYRQGILAGNSIYVDRRFLKKYMPAFEGYLHYRQIDVSSIKILAQNWYPRKASGVKNPSTHTALEDIKNSIEELKYYKEKIFISK